VIGLIAIGIKICTIRFVTKLIEKVISLNNALKIFTYIICFPSIRKHEIRECGIKIWLYSFFNLWTSWWWMIKAMQCQLYHSKEIRFTCVCGRKCRAVEIKKISFLTISDSTTVLYIPIKSRLFPKVLCVSELKKKIRLLM